MWCQASMGEKDGEGVEGISHGICRSCWEKRYPQWSYPKDEKKEGQ